MDGVRRCEHMEMKSALREVGLMGEVGGRAVGCACGRSCGKFARIVLSDTRAINEGM